MASVTNVKVGVCSVVYNGLDLGHTSGGVQVTYKPEYFDVTVDKYGKTQAESVLIGETFEAKVPLAESTIANLKSAIAAATFAGAANARVTIGKTAGFKSSSVAAQLVLHPIAEGTLAFDIVLYKAVVQSQIVLEHSIDKERIVEVTFEALVDESRSDGNYLGLIGDSTK